MNIAVLGTFSGDEAKGRITHYLSRSYDFVVRYSGGNNTGATVHSYKTGKKYIHHLIPAIDFENSKAKGFIGAGTVVDLKSLFEEIIDLEKDFKGIADRIYVDLNAFLVLPKHIEEDKAKNGHIGSTNKGIGPAYVDKVSRNGLRISDVGIVPEVSEWYNKLCDIGVHFTHLLNLYDEFKSSNLLFEGSQGVLIDLNHGTYPYVSCGDATIAGIHTSGFNFIKLDKVYGVLKCYSTRVGNGPFPTEIFGEESDELRMLGNEYGATTGRPRRIGWLDLPALKYACRIAGITNLVITKFDILNGYDKVKVCYDYEDGEPVCPNDFFDAVPIYKNVKIWNKPEDLTEFISMVEEYTDCKVDYISHGTSEFNITKL